MTPEQQEILDLITKVWKKRPELRFCQLIGNCFAFGDDTYYVPNRAFTNVFRGTYSEDL